MDVEIEALTVEKPEPFFRLRRKRAGSQLVLEGFDRIVILTYNKREYVASDYVFIASYNEQFIEMCYAVRVKIDLGLGEREYQFTMKCRAPHEFLVCEIWQYDTEEKGLIPIPSEQFKLGLILGDRLFLVLCSPVGRKFFTDYFTRHSPDYLFKSWKANAFLQLSLCD